MIKKIFFLLAVNILFIFYCTNKTYVIQQDYVHSRINEISLLVVNFNELEIINDQIFREDDPETRHLPETKYYTLYQLIQRALGKKKTKKKYIQFFNNTTLDFLGENILFTEVYLDTTEIFEFCTQKELTINDTTKDVFYIPDSAMNSFAINEVMPDFILIISGIEISAKEVEIPMPHISSDPFMTSSFTEVHIFQETHYTIWDNYKEKIVSYGIANVSLKLEDLDKELLAELATDNIKKIIEDSPFKRPRQKW